MAKKGNISFFGSISFLVGLIASLFLLLSYTSIYFNPRDYWFFAFFGLAYPIILFGNIALLVFWIFRKRKKMLFPLLAIIIGIPIHQDVFQFNTSSDKEIQNGEKVKIMTYNVHNFRAFDKNVATKKIKTAMLDIIKKEQPNIICFQEFYTRKKGEYATIDSIKKYTNLKHVYFEKVYENDFEMGGLCIFSQYPIVNKDFIQLTKNKSDNSVQKIDIKIKDKTYRLFNVHLQSINFQPEDYKYMDQIKNKMEADNASSKKIGYRLKRAFSKRSSQSKFLNNEVMASPYPVILCGDFNDTPVSFTYHTLTKNLKSTFKEKGFGMGVTYNGAFPNFQIDYILCSPRFEVVDYNIIRKKLSDHYPVVSTIIIK